MPKLQGDIELFPAKEDVPDKISSSLSRGVTEKKILCDQFGAYYLFKKSDPLIVNEVFRGYLSPEQQLSLSFDPREHIFSVQLEGAFLEILISCLAKKMFEGILIVPEIYLHVDKDKSIGTISKFMEGFSEFLAEKEVVKTAPLFERQHLPKRADLLLTKEEAMILGQLYAVALIFNLWDLLNSKLLNSGYCVGKEETKLASIVDFGCGGPLSYRGRHTDTLALDDPDFSPGKKISYSFFGQNFRDHYRHGYALPFDHLVAPLLPHVVIADLFDLSGPDPISQSMLEGYSLAITTAERNMARNPHLLEEALKQSYLAITSDSLIQAADLKLHLNAEFYGKPKQDSHNLIHILKQRLSSAKRLFFQFKEGISATALQEEVRDIYYHAQCWKSTGP